MLGRAIRHPLDDVIDKMQAESSCEHSIPVSMLKRVRASVALRGRLYERGYRPYHSKEHKVKGYSKKAIDK